MLTIGFARRVPSYKRLTLMLRDPARLKKLLTHPERPIQLIIAGKAHPADDGGKKLIQEIVRFADDPEVRHRIVFMPNYDIAMALPLYPGCDVWLNNPLRPPHAAGPERRGDDAAADVKGAGAERRTAGIDEQRARTGSFQQHRFALPDVEYRQAQCVGSGRRRSGNDADDDRGDEE